MINNCSQKIKKTTTFTHNKILTPENRASKPNLMYLNPLHWDKGHKPACL
ncbi:MAG: hypothetical protein OFPII_05170 [Osedax symbiont Rs1]|nr:MAG: hypothetical protein OFPII_05170 [Osedax symbiont Rs1]